MEDPSAPRRLVVRLRRGGSWRIGLRRGWTIRLRQGEVVLTSAMRRDFCEEVFCEDEVVLCGLEDSCDHWLLLCFCVRVVFLDSLNDEKYYCSRKFELCLLFVVLKMRNGFGDGRVLNKLQWA